MSLYGDYIKEREDFEIVENEFGFASFKIAEKNCYIRDIYIVPDMRKSHVASSLADKITEIAKERGCNSLTGTVSPLTKGATSSLKVLMAYGFEVLSSHENLIIFKKEI